MNFNLKSENGNTEQQDELAKKIVAIALVFAGRGIYRLFRNAKKGKGCGCNCGCGGKGTNKKSCL